MSGEPTTRGPLDAPSDLELMQWVDAELDPEREAEVRAFVERNPRAKRIVDSLLLAAGVVRDDLLERATTSGADDVADAVMEQIDRERPSHTVVSLPRRNRLK